MFFPRCKVWKYMNVLKSLIITILIINRHAFLQNMFLIQKLLNQYLNESMKISLAFQWKIAELFLFLYSKTDIVWTSNFFNSLNDSFNLFLIIGLVIICTSGSKKKNQNLNIIVIYTTIRRIWLHYDCKILFYLIRYCKKYIKGFKKFSKSATHLV